MASGSTRKRRGNIEERAGSYRVRVYAGVDPITKKPVYLRQTIPAGPTARRDAERTLTKLQNQVDERRAPRTSATLNQLLDRYFAVGLDVAPSTKQDYISKANKHIRPLLGATPISKIDVHTLESLYADLRRCRDHCHGRRYVQHRTDRPHACDEHGPGGPCNPFDPDCRRCRRMCGPHQCKPFKDSGILTIHWVLSGAFAAAVRWGWLGVNTVKGAKKPGVPPSQPQPPTVQEAARLVNEAWVGDADWGAFVWTATTSGARRGELCALHWYHLVQDGEVVDIRRAIAKDDNGRWYEKDTKSHQQRRVVLDQETAVMLKAHRARCEALAQELGIKLDPNGYVFSLAPDHSPFLIPDTATQRYDRMAERLSIDTTLHKLRHYSATELLNGGMDVRAVAGRLGHGSGGAMTLRAYAAWLAEADQRAAPILAGRMPALPASIDVSRDVAADHHQADADASETGPYLEVARDLRGAITCGAIGVGDTLPTLKELAHRYGIAVGTAHRAISVLADEGLIHVSRGRRAVVARTT